ncbi:DegT/DnrJ/EryC1/StrS family aminotransferase [Agrilutibacter solisilvae]|uniref:DegT/DnrJ/EryC1/StrS family aminotransferase n=1 Tax=Agrilutibacter solisilvae TaxID=2763317 RepID=A0A975ARZ5_9GAMM|nr:DegT/DnrJ/EryC1/StrS family aminotransferase [Lysobacter solisilvae]QSX77455.1 DegT/DnrJ/EryC1/StrS family aminotransferase [Lysobacter solisilvae]
MLNYYDAHLARHGDTASGAAWPDEAGRRARFRMGIDLVLQHAGQRRVTLCDLGCGTGELYRFLQEEGFDDVGYIGIDRSSLAIGIARAKFPDVAFHCLDLLDADGKTLDRLLDCDFVFANGLFTVRHEATHEQMWAFMTRMLEATWPRVRRGIVFNVMSTLVDWERDDLFHVSYDDLARYLRGLAGRAIGFRADRDLYELMAFALKDDLPPPGRRPIAAGREADAVPVCRPRLPRVKDLTPFLERMDDARRYTNHGTLSAQFTRGLAQAFGVREEEVCLASSGTSALIAAILATAGRATSERPWALCPAYTFAATALAAEACGYQPRLIDVDSNGWMPTPEFAARQPLERVGLALATAAYGQSVPQQAWSEFSRDSGIPVVIDAAAAFEQACDHPDDTFGTVPVVLSMHATKAFGIGEGGAVLCTDRGVIERTYGALNFGFLGARECRMPGINGKLSEYHAAVGLAQLARWPSQRHALSQVAQAYQKHARSHGLAGRIVTAPRVASCYALFVARDATEAAAATAALAAARVGFRRWYGVGLHNEPHFVSAPRGLLANTERIATCLIGLPMAPDLHDTEIARVVAALAEAAIPHAQAGITQAGRGVTP